MSHRSESRQCLVAGRLRSESRGLWAGRLDGQRRHFVTTLLFASTLPCASTVLCQHCPVPALLAITHSQPCAPPLHANGRHEELDQPGRSGGDVFLMQVFGLFFLLQSRV